LANYIRHLLHKRPDRIAGPLDKRIASIGRHNPFSLGLSGKAVRERIRCLGTAAQAASQQKRQTVPKCLAQGTHFPLLL
jgi:hypothetical protein